MADRITVLEAEKAALQATSPSKPRVKSSTHPQPPDDATIVQSRLELAEALRSQGVAETRLLAAEQELTMVKSKAKDDTRNIRKLDSELSTIKTKFRDREHELKEMRKLLEHVQDEMITLNLTIDVVEKERDRAKQENKELVARWMRRMEQEVEAMNLANEPHLDTGKGKGK